MLKPQLRELAEHKVDLMRRILSMTEEISVALGGENAVEIMGVLLKRQGLMTQVDEVDAKLKGHEFESDDLPELAAKSAALARASHDIDGANLERAHQMLDDLRLQIERVDRGRRSANAYETAESPGRPLLLDERK